MPDEAIVRRLVASQFPQWRGLPVVQIKSSGTDNAVFRLGEDLAVRLPRVDYAARLLLKEAACLPLLAPLPLEIPVVIGLGQPDETYLWNWLVVSWLRGEPVDVGQ